MATTITQKPLYEQLPAGQDVIFTVANANIVANQTRVKFVAEVHISPQFPVNLGTSTNLIGTFKTTPNNEGVGMFDLGSIIENYVKADSEARNNSSYKGTLTADDRPHPIHLIDKYSGNINSFRYLAVKFYVEYLDTSVTPNAITAVDYVSSDQLQLFNGYSKHTDKLEEFQNDFGYTMGNFNPASAADSTKRFLTNAPVTQYANLEDYGTLSYLAPNGVLDYIKLTYLDSSGSSLGTENISRTSANGAYNTYNGYAQMQLIYFGCYPGNLQNWSSTFQALVTAGTIEGGSIQVRGYDSSDVTVTKLYTINVNCPNLKRYSPIRLTWLNQWGAWDYYTFTMKSIRTLSTKGTTYTQSPGTWNKSTYRISGYKGGEKSFRINATEKIRMNTDFVSESEGEWFEELINSPEVYMLDGFQNDSNYALLNTYVTPVRITTTSYTRKTIANDRLMQYTFEIDKSKTLRTQSI